jgi:hypothetical protein
MRENIREAGQIAIDAVITFFLLPMRWYQAWKDK